jgi:altronate hydrolase
MIHLHPNDNVAIATFALSPGSDVVVKLASGERMTLQVEGEIPPGHKVAIYELAPGDPVRRYGQVIGTAAVKILPGEHIHSHNISIAYPFDRQTHPSPHVPNSIRSKSGVRTFLGIPRADGRVGTRNYIAVIASVNCSAHVCRQIAAYFTQERLADYPNIDGVISLTHEGGCGRPDYAILQRTLAGMAKHPNVGGYLMVGLGCEGNQLGDLSRSFGLPDPALAFHPGEPAALVIQESGGTAGTIQAGIEAVKAMLPSVNAAERSPQPVSKLNLALECGGSDSWSGITANPLVGLLADEIVQQGGTVVLSETPEIYGAQHLLASRAITPEVGDKLLAKIAWWQDYLSRIGSDFDDNPSPGNRAGGLSNICEKSLGAIAKGGSTPLMAVYDYAQQIQQTGLVFMDTTGNDPVSVTGMVAGGCNIVVFTTGRGSVFGFKPAPVIKICSNTQTFRRMTGDMDFNAGKILDGGLNFESSVEQIFEMVLEVASGQHSKSEDLGIGEAEFVPWSSYGVV